ncbi:hypothetical protein FHG87_014203 [Trinorchestia longiramus]|nr:hypothetical protein FHG87_014203 [Trinorchestia longiramus]
MNFQNNYTRHTRQLNGIYLTCRQHGPRNTINGGPHGHNAASWCCNKLATPQSLTASSSPSLVIITSFLNVFAAPSLFTFTPTQFFPLFLPLLTPPLPNTHLPLPAQVFLWSRALLSGGFTAKSATPAFHLSNNLQMARDSCNADAKCLRHFSNTLTWILLNNRMQLLVLETIQTSSTLFIFKILITTPEFSEPPSYCPVPCGLFTSCSVDIGRSFGSVVPKFELVQHK